MTADQLCDIEAQKRVATVRARIALRGAILHVLENDHGRPAFIVSHWSLTREFEDVGQVEEWLDRTEARGRAGNAPGDRA